MKHSAEASGAPSFPPLDGVRHRFIDAGGLRMHIAEAGSGDPVLLLHGFPQHWWEWHDVIPRLADRYYVICPDLRGAGWTDAPPTGYRREQLLADVVALMDALRIDRVRVIGHDWGALVGFQLCLEHPDRVAQFISLATPHPFIRFDKRLLKNFWRLWFQPVIGAPLIGRRLVGGRKQRLPRFLLRGEKAAGHTWSERDIDIYAAQFQDPARARAGSLLYRGFIMPEARRIVAGAYRGTRLTTPTRVLYGADDPIIIPELLGGYEGYSDDLAQEVVDGAGHFIADQRPDVVVDRALGFFASETRA